MQGIAKEMYWIIFKGGGGGGGFRPIILETLIMRLKPISAKFLPHFWPKLA